MAILNKITVNNDCINSTYDAIKIIENYCCSHYGTCEIKKTEKINEEEDIC